MKAVFVTGTDTGAGKTVVSGLLGRFLLEKGYRVITQKWIQTGSGNFPKDINSHLKLMKMPRHNIKEYLSYMFPYTFKFASSPHLAASLEKRTISIKKIKKCFKFLQKGFDFVIVEGAGGALVPFNRKRLIIDIARELNLPVLIVASNKLGAINHTLLTIEAIKRRGMKIIGIIFNNRYRKVSKIILKDNAKIVAKLTGEKILGTLPYIKDKNRLYKSFLPIGNKITIEAKPR